MHAPFGGSVVVDAGVFVENIVVSRNLSIYRCKLTAPVTAFHCAANGNQTLNPHFNNRET